MIAAYVAAGVVGAWAGSVGLMLRNYGKRLEANLDRGATSAG